MLRGNQKSNSKFKMSESQTNQAFINEDFLLESKSAKILYHDYAKDYPIIDYHNHLSPKAICEIKFTIRLLLFGWKETIINGGHFELWN